LAVQLQSSAWQVPPIFQMIRRRGNVTQDEMYHVFNMGIGMVVMASPGNARRIIKKLPEIKPIGEIVAQNNWPRVILD
jgi:phosphoribosylformylglycinamidine cyclo-ligase